MSVARIKKNDTVVAIAGEYAGQTGKVLRVMASELALWFPQHAQSMDASLALHLRRVGFDPATGVVHAPTALPEALIHGCGGATCSDSGAPGAAEPATQRDAASAVAA